MTIIHQNCLLVTRQNDKHSAGPGGLALTTEVNLGLTTEVNLATLFSAPSVEEIRETAGAFQSLMVWGKTTLINVKSLKVRYRTPSQSYEDCFGVREYIIMVFIG